ncbi:ABC-type transport auxiliary lipoprotein family protein [Campylobacter sp.]|uniref:ABC-type transport auxiliary lipoprotein family protein n=1 Tax=Campylobacter sp. TaxID=205 RepID=UPI00270FA42C|nr:ABC-type transport auxiliary lipoprotein family protein [Campylobacter sp.]
MRNLIFVLAFAAVFSGCTIVAKSAPENRYFILGNSDFKICQDKESRRHINIRPVKSQSPFDTKEIMMIDKNSQIYPMKDARWIALPSEMIYTKILSEIEGGCLFKTSLDRANLSLQTTLLSLNADEERALISLSVTLSKNDKILKSEIVSAAKPLASKEAKEVINALNSALDEAVGKILNILKEYK